MAKSNAKLVKATKDLRLVNAHNALKVMRTQAQAGTLHDERKFDLLVLEALVLLTDNVIGTTLVAPVTPVRPPAHVANFPGTKKP